MQGKMSCIDDYKYVKVIYSHVMEAGSEIFTMFCELL